MGNKEERSNSSQWLSADSERYANGILWSSALKMILVRWVVTEKKMCCGGKVLYRSK